MTTYAKKEVSTDYLQATFELKSLNSRFCDVNVKIPKWMGVYEERIRKIIYNEMKRGKIDFSISIENVSDYTADVIPDINLAKSYLIAIKKISETLNLPFNIGISEFLSTCRDVLVSKKNNYDEEKIWTIIESVLMELIEDAKRYSLIEGNNIKNDLLSRIENIKLSLNKITKDKEIINSQVKHKIGEKISRLMEDFNLRNSINEDRLMQEVVYYLDRTDITEEIVRANSHLEQFINTINADNVEKGKRLDFLIQEIFREFNTMGNKVLNDELSHYVVDVKVELEKIREQVQNVL